MNMQSVFESKLLIRFTCTKNYHLLDLITKNDDLFYDLSFVSLSSSISKL